MGLFMTLNINYTYHKWYCHYIECRCNYLNVMLSVVMSSVIMISVVAQWERDYFELGIQNYDDIIRN
jgi:hypothetical protein